MTLLIVEIPIQYFVFQEVVIKEHPEERVSLTSVIVSCALRGVKLGLDIYIIVLFTKLFKFFIAMKKAKLERVGDELSPFNRFMIGTVILIASL